MKCLRLEAVHRIRAEEIKEPGKMTREKGQLKIRIRRISLCGSDIKLYDGHYSGPCRYPLIFGHEWSGDIIEVSEEEKYFKPGDHVTGDCSRWCGECDNCKKDKNICRHIEKFGITIDGYSLQVITADRKYIYRSENKLPHKVLALAEPFAVSLHALHSVHMEELPAEAKVLVIGCGAIGVAAYMFLTRKYGCGNVFISEMNRHRLNTMKHIFRGDSLKIVTAASNDSAERTYASMYAGQGFDYVFDASGSVRGLEAAIEYANPFGTITYIGLTEGQLKNTNQITMKKLTIQGSIGGTGEFEEAIQFMEDNQETVAQIVTFETDCDNAKAAFEEMIHSPANIKCQIIF